MKSLIEFDYDMDYNESVDELQARQVKQILAGCMS